MDLDFSRCAYPPFAHQKVGVEKLLDHPFFFLCDQMGAGKTAQVILASQFLYEQGTIDKVLIVCPAAVRSVWHDPELGELTKHLWPTTPVRITLYHSRLKMHDYGPPSDHPLQILVTNYEFIRAKERLAQLLPFCSSQTLLVCDESSAIKSHKSQQFAACLQIRRACGRVVLLNGTPIANNPLDLFAQGNLLSPVILDCKYITHFKFRYAKMEPVITRGGKALVTDYGKPINKIVGWQRIPELQTRFAPYTIRRLKEECLDLPPKLDPVTLTATLSTTWPAYKAMRDDMVIQLSSGDLSVAQQVITKMIRLAQVTSGFIGGVENILRDDVGCDGSGTVLYDPGPNQFGEMCPGCPACQPEMEAPLPTVQEIGREKLDVLLEWLDGRLEEDPSFKVVVGCRFRPEIERTARELRQRYPAMAVGLIYGGQKKSERTDALRLLDPRTAPEEPVAVLMTSAGSLGISLTAANTFIRLSRDFSLFQSLQADERIHRPGQTRAVSYYDIIAEGPRGMPTIDRIILTAIREKRDVANMTADAWRAALRGPE